MVMTLFLLFVVVGCFLPGDEKVEKHGVVVVVFPRFFLVVTFLLLLFLVKVVVWLNFCIRKSTAKIHKVR